MMHTLSELLVVLLLYCSADQVYVYSETFRLITTTVYDNMCAGLELSLYYTKNIVCVFSIQYALVVFISYSPE